MEAASRTHELPPPIPIAASDWIRSAAYGGVGVLTIALLLGFASLVASLRSAPPWVGSGPDPLRSLSDPRAVGITFTTSSWAKRRAVVTVDRLNTDRTVWQRMHFDDWDGVPPARRTRALLSMVHAYAGVFEGPAVWRRMTPGDWDGVPQPIRSMAYLRMVWYWARFEHVGAEFGLVPDHVAQTIGAIVMAESWFEHRATNENSWGNRDLGLAQCSDYCRHTLAEMAARSEIPVAFQEADYFNPWTATRIATLWFERELLRADGDVDLATRAYHRGLDHAFDEKGDAYLARVQRLRERYIRAQGTSQTWRWLTNAIASLPHSPDAPHIQMSRVRVIDVEGS